MGRTLLISGGTGFIGSHFALHALRGGDAERIWVLARSKSGDAAEARVRGALRKAAFSCRPVLDHAALLHRVEVVESDLGLPQLGLNGAAQSRLHAGSIDELWHFGACIRAFDAGERGDDGVNVAGTLAAVALASRLGARRFVLVSTAYVAGTQSGTLAEALHAPSAYNNDYERSKCAAENAACRACAAQGMALVILRPSVVLGPAATKLSGGSRHGLYALLKELQHIVAACSRNEPVADLAVLAGGGEINFVPVDHVVEDMLSVLRSPPAPGCRILHLTDARNFPVSTLLEMLAERLGLRKIRSCERMEAIPERQRWLQKRLRFYRAYTDGRKSFERSLPSRPGLADADMLNFIEAGLRELRYGSLDQLADMPEVVRADGSRIPVYEAGNRAHPAVVIVNAFGMPVDVWSPLIAELRSRYHVLTWDCRGLPDLREDVDRAPLDTNAHLSDLFTIVEACGAREIAIVGWSTGALIAAKAAVALGARCVALALLHGSFMLKGTAWTEFQKNMKLLMPKVAVSRAVARTMFKVAFSDEVRSIAFRWADHILKRKVKQIMGTTNPAYLHLIGVPTRGVEELYRYARLVAGYIAERPEEPLGRVQCPVLLLTATGDDTAHPEGTFAAERLLSRASARCICVQGGDHFTFYNDAAARAALVAFIGKSHQPKEPRTPAGPHAAREGALL